MRGRRRRLGGAAFGRLAQNFGLTTVLCLDGPSFGENLSCDETASCDEKPHFVCENVGDFEHVDRSAGIVSKEHVSSNSRQTLQKRATADTHRTAPNPTPLIQRNKLPIAGPESFSFIFI